MSTDLQTFDKLLDSCLESVSSSSHDEWEQNFENAWNHFDQWVLEILEVLEISEVPKVPELSPLKIETPNPKN